MDLSWIYFYGNNKFVKFPEPPPPPPPQPVAYIDLTLEHETNNEKETNPFEPCGEIWFSDAPWKKFSKESKKLLSQAELTRYFSNDYKVYDKNANIISRLDMWNAIKNNLNAEENAPSTNTAKKGLKQRRVSKNSTEIRQRAADKDEEEILKSGENVQECKKRRTGKKPIIKEFKIEKVLCRVPLSEINKYA